MNLLERDWLSDRWVNEDLMASLDAIADEPETFYEVGEVREANVVQGTLEESCEQLSTVHASALLRKASIV